MNKSFLTLAALSVLALAACKEEATDTTANDVVSSVEESATDTFEAAATLVDETTGDAEALYDEAVSQVQEEASEIAPAAGDVTETEETNN